MKAQMSMKIVLKKILLVHITVVTYAIRVIFPVKSNKILLWSYSGKKYACNPKYISEYIGVNHPQEYEIIWAVNNTDDSIIPYAKHVIRKQWNKIPTFRFLFEINTSEFIITNSRTSKLSGLLTKRDGQKYIMTWHSSMSIKPVERDVEIQLGADYCNTAKHDSHLCDLILSGCKFRSDVIKRAFWYNGEILESGTPRNDVLLNEDMSTRNRNIINSLYGTSDKIIVLYAPTFRKHNDTNHSPNKWKLIISSIEEKFGRKAVLLYRLHPNIQNMNFDESSMAGIEWRNVSLYNDMQELLSASDILITDYSSSCFDFALTHKPCFVYAKDIKSYERGYYLPIETLPFPSAVDDDGLQKCIESFDINKYIDDVDTFLQERICSFEKGHACADFYDWMKCHSI